jgi:thioredoxin 1
MASVHIACLCAAWCRLCDEYRPMLQALAAEFTRAGVRAHWHWVDIEDEADLVGELDVETFPTLVIADDTHVRFAGPVTPQRDTLQRLLRATVLEAQPDAAWPAVDPAVRAFASGLRQRKPDGFARAHASRNTENE